MNVSNINITPSVPLSLSFENRAPLTIPLPERQTQWDGGSRCEPCMPIFKEISDYVEWFFMVLFRII